MFSEQQVKKLFASRWWEGEGKPIDDKALCALQLSQDHLCLPYALFHAALERALGAGVMPENLTRKRWDWLKEISGKKYALSDEECLQILPSYAREALRGG